MISNDFIFLLFLMFSVNFLCFWFFLGAIVLFVGFLVCL